MRLGLLRLTAVLVSFSGVCLCLCLSVFVSVSVSVSDFEVFDLPFKVLA